MTSLQQALLAYVPRLVLERLRPGESPELEARAESLHGALLSADISGSTELAERLASDGAAGAEAFNKILNRTLGSVVDAIEDWGGDVVKFTGDGLLALWPVADRDGLAAATLTAAGCALEVRRRLASAPAEGGVRLSARIGIGCGELSAVRVGGYGGRLEIVVMGPTLVDTSLAERAAPAGEVVIAPRARECLAEAAFGTPLPGGALRLEGLHGAVLPARTERVELPPPSEALLRAYAPLSVLSRLEAGQSDWLSELRRVSMMFVRLHVGPRETLEALQSVVRRVQRALERYEGVLARIGVDERGLVVLAGFGLPPFSHDDDPQRAAQAALELRAALQTIGVRTSFGVATGRVFCGAVGTAQRREYTVVGDAANVAARLMEAASDDALCDAATFAAARGAIQFESLAPLLLKGKATSVPAHRPIAVRKVAISSSPLVGRATERARLRAHLERLCTDGTSGVIAIEGEPGIGKSRLVADLVEAAADRPVTVLQGTADAIERTTPYHAWRSIFAQQLGADPTLLEDQTAGGPNEKLVELLQRAAKERPLLVVLEDAHALDSASRVLARLVAQSVRPALLVVVTRSSPEQADVELRQLLSTSPVEVFHLAPLSADEANTLVCLRLGVERLAEPVAELVRERAGGHPLFCAELAVALRDARRVTIADRECRVTAGAGDLRTLALPETLEGVVTSRIDRTTPRQQVTLKVASVIGQTFRRRTLEDVHPIAADRANVADDLAALTDLGLVEPAPDEPEPSHRFTHAIIREVAYHLMSFAQRGALHRSLVLWHEQEPGAEAARISPVLAHHASEAARADQSRVPDALRYLEIAGEQAAATYANREAVHLFSRLLALVRGGGDGPATSVDSSVSRARWERMLGEAHFRLGALDDARLHLEAALSLARESLPATRARLGLGLAREIARQAVYRAVPARWLRPAGAKLAATTEASLAWNFVQMLRLTAMEPLAAVYASARCLNLAERTRPSRSLSYAYGGAAALTNLLSRRLAGHYLKLARRVAEELDDDSARLANAYATGYVEVQRAHWAEARDAFRLAQALSARTQDRRFWEMSTLQVGAVAFARGEFRDALASYSAARDSAQRRGDTDAESLAAIGRVTALALLGDTDGALASLRALMQWLGADFALLRDVGIEINAHAMLALALARRGERELAWAAANAAVELMTKAPPFAHYALAGYAAAAEATLLCAASSADAAERARWLELARAACAALQRFARAFPIGRPQAFLWRGVYAELRGDLRRARRAFRRSERAAAALEVAYMRLLARERLTQTGVPAAISRSTR